jgi:peroxiredoxin family protein
MEHLDIPSIPEFVEMIADTGAGMYACKASVDLFGLDAIHQGRHDHIKLATVGNPGLHLPTMAGGLPGVSTVMTHYMNHKMEQLDIPSIPEFIEMIADTGAGMYACKASVDLFGLEKNDFIPEIQDIITVGEFYEIAAGGQIIFT